ncbi:hypothetical protein AAFF_G00161650 [Aldrovandia affinis]|uniref:CRIB domain-containing protein n=1 Tax=Aldrovandia affinis TaxID=143900 RepID=A0AAD7RN02_9TELE|nr:hypothetical protein AAFF_G00161650 [Aldrovandia affinis]
MFSYSWKKQKALMRAQNEQSLPLHKLITESPTRWGSRLQMMERVLEQEKAITQVLAADKKTRHLVPTWQDIQVLESVTAALKPLQDFTDALSGEAYARAASETEALLVENTALGESPLAEDHTDREKEAATAPQSAKKPKKSLGSLFKKTSSAPASCSQRQIIEQELNSYILAMAADRPTLPMATVDIKNPEINNVRFHNNNIMHSSFSKEVKGKQKKLTKADIGTPRNFQHIGHVGWDPNTGFDLNNLDPELKNLFDMCGISEAQLKDKETSKVIYDFIEKRGGVEAVKNELRRQGVELLPRPRPRPPTEAEPPPSPPIQNPPPPPPLSSRGHLRHIGHMGWDPNTGFDLNNLDPELKNLFDMCGISEAQLKDKETSKVIYDFIEKRGGVEAVKNELRRQGLLIDLRLAGASLDIPNIRG